MNSIIYNKLILRLHGNESVGSVLTDPQLSKYDVTKAVTQGSPIVRLKLLNHFLDHPHHGGDVSAFFEQEAHNINFGQTALKWVEAFPSHSNIILSYCVKHLQAIHCKDFIAACAKRITDNPADNTVYNHALLYEVFRIQSWPPNIMPLIFECIKDHSIEWKSIMAVKLARCAHTAAQQDIILSVVQQLPSIRLGEDIDMLYQFATPVHQPLLQIILQKVPLEDFKNLVLNFKEHYDPNLFEVFNACVPNDLAYKQTFFEKMCQFHQTGWINDDLYSQMERAWLEANVATTPATSVKRKM